MDEVVIVVGPNGEVIGSNVKSADVGFAARDVRDRDWAKFAKEIGDVASRYLRTDFSFTGVEIKGGDLLEEFGAGWGTGRTIFERERLCEKEAWKEC